MSLKLCYIWIKEFREFKDTGFNFSSSEKFKFDPHSNQLSIEKITELPRYFFGESISDVTALIGRNGSGKSNALELICKLLKGGKSLISDDFIIVTEEDGKKVCYNNLKYNLGVRANFPLKLKDYVRKIDPLKIVYFSNVYDQRIHNFDKDISDISNNFRYPRSRYNYNRNTDFEKQLQFIESDLFKNLNIDFPNEIRITNKIWNNNSMNSSRKQQIFASYLEDFLDFSKQFRARINDFRDQDRLYCSLIYSLLIEAILILNLESAVKGDYKDHLISKLLNIPKNSKYVRVEEFINKYLEWVLYYYDYLGNFQELKTKTNLQEFLDKKNALFSIRDYINDLNVKSYSEGKGLRSLEYFTFDYIPESKSINHRHLGLFERNSFFNINWSGISSGHKAYLNIFSLLNFELKRIRRENVLICIDEGDLYLHPQWQLEFFDKIMTVIPQIFKGNIQIVLTSHSPFLLSDLPKQCVTIIDLSQEQQTVDGIELRSETFAGNIYKLYSEPFFLGKERLSVFAKKKVDGILKKLETLKKDPKSYSKANLMKEISLIGDDVIRFHLMKSLNND